MSSVFQENFIKSFKGVSRIFQWSFFCNFVVAWISLQLPEQKEGLFDKNNNKNNNNNRNKNNNIVGIKIRFKVPNKPIRLRKNQIIQNLIFVSCVCMPIFRFVGYIQLVVFLLQYMKRRGKIAQSDIYHCCMWYPLKGNFTWKKISSSFLWMFIF